MTIFPFFPISQYFKIPIEHIKYARYGQSVCWLDSLPEKDSGGE